jgi:hypothetical protein
MRRPRLEPPITTIRNCDFHFARAALTMVSMVSGANGEAMGNDGSVVASGVRGLLDRLFERLERAKLKDLERSIARAANEREVSQRVHRLEAGEAPLN